MSGKANFTTTALTDTIGSVSQGLQNKYTNFINWVIGSINQFENYFDEIHKKTESAKTLISNIQQQVQNYNALINDVKNKQSQNKNLSFDDKFNFLYDKIEVLRKLIENHGSLNTVYKDMHKIHEKYTNLIQLNKPQEITEKIKFISSDNILESSIKEINSRKSSFQGDVDIASILNDKNKPDKDKIITIMQLLTDHALKLRTEFESNKDFEIGTNLEEFTSNISQLQDQTKL